MSIKIMQEVWDSSGVAQGTLLVLLALADSADERSRECWPAISSIAKKARLSDRQVQRCITELSEAKIVVIFPNAGRSGSNVFRIEEVTKWRGCQNVGGDAHVTGGVTPMSPGGVTPMSPKPSLRTINEPSITCEADLFTANETLAPRPTPKAEKKKPEDEFERFWSAYPLKKAKAAAEKNWAKAIKKAAPEIIIAAAERYSQSRDVARGFAKYAQGWLSDERWKDGPEPQPSDPEPARNYGGHRRSEPWGEVVR